MLANPVKFPSFIITSLAIFTCKKGQSMKRAILRWFVQNTMMNRVKISGGVVIIIILVGVFFLRGFTIEAAHASSPASCTWTLISTQNPSMADGLNAITAITSKDVWAVGSFANQGSSGPFQKTLTERWNGTSWQVVPSPNPGAGYNSLMAVARIPGGGLWAVGYMSNTTSGPPTDQTLIEHWDGKTWQVVASPNVGSNNNELYGVVALSATDAWAVGSYQSASPFDPQPA